MSISRRSVAIVSMLEVVLLGTLMFLCLKKWYPEFYFELFDAGFSLIVFLCGLLIVGPLLSVLVYKRDAISYINDLSVIFLIRLVVLLVGLHFFFSQRPLLVVYSVDRFVVVQAYQIPPGTLPPEIATLILARPAPPVIASRRLEEGDLDALLGIMSGAPDIEYRPSQYERFAYQRSAFVERLCSTDKSDRRACVNQVPVPLVYQFENYATAVFDFEQEKVITVLDRDPW